MILLAGIFIAGCTSEDDGIGQEQSFQSSNETSSESKEVYKERFAKILSLVVYQDEGVRSLLKEEAMKEFDCNHEVLWYLVRDKTL